MFVLGAIFIAPCLPTRSQKAPSGSAWIHEIKHDGYRLIARDGRHNLVGLPTVPRQHRHFPERCIWSFLLWDPVFAPLLVLLFSNPVSSMCFTGASATRSRTVWAKPCKRSAQVRLILAIVAAATLTPKRSAINAARRFSGSN